MKTAERGIGAAAARERADDPPPLAAIALGHLASAAGDEAAPEARWLGEVRNGLGAPCAPLGEAVDGWRRRPPPSDGRLHRLCTRLALDPIEGLATALSFTAETDLMAGRALRWLQSPVPAVRPTIGLMVCLGELLGRSSEETLAVLLDGPAVRVGLLHLEAGERPLVEASLRIPPPLVSALGGGEGRWSGVTTRCAAVELAGSVVAEAAHRGARLVRPLVVRSGDRAEARAFCERLCSVREIAPAFVDLGALAAGRLAGLGPWLLLRERLPVVCGEVLPGESTELPDIPGYEGPILVATSLEGRWLLDGSALECWTIPMPPPAERIELWREAGLDADVARRLGPVYRIGAARIRRLAEEARSHSGDDAPPELPDVAGVARRAQLGGLGALAEPLTEDIGDEALVLAAGLRADLEALEDRCRVRDGLADELGPAARARYRPGVRALMVGPSGTGKTLACGWLATRLGLPLYRVDLAAVSSKYIGETEKNLGDLFARAEHAGVVLMFDEADALFGKRTDVKDAHDRYANQQTNYLLQRIEDHDGIVLLTSNSRARFDSAFARRLDAVIEFPPPQPSERRALWRAHVGAASDLTAAQLNRLAAGCELAGGHIRNVVLAAQARTPDRALDWDSLLVALTSEYRKLGKPLPAGLVGRPGAR